MQEAPRFDGSDYDPSTDDRRLTKQIIRIIHLMRDSAWRTLYEISNLTGDPQASISAQLRHLRKKRFGSHQINKRRKGKDSCGLWEYQLIWNVNERA